MADMPEDEEHQLALQAERVRQMLRDAFPGAFCEPPEGKTFAHAAFVEMRTDLPLFFPETLQSFLPQILEELMDTHTNDDVDTENAEFVLMRLNVDAYTSEETYARQRDTFGEAVVEHDRKASEYLRKSRREGFALTTPDQAKAIYQWLLLARNWRDFAIWSDDLEGALEYWKGRANAS